MPTARYRRESRMAIPRKIFERPSSFDGPRSHVYSNCRTLQGVGQRGPGPWENILGGVVDRLVVEHGERVEGDGRDRMTYACWAATG